MDNIFEGKTRGLTFKGLGVVDHPDGRVFFVKGSWPGDEGIFEIESIQKNYGFAKLKEIKAASPARRKPECEHLGLEAGQCGGCPWMIVKYDEQIKEKFNLLSQLLERSKIEMASEILKPIIASPNEFGYRNRAQFKTNGKKIGYVTPESHNFAEIKKCIVLDKKTNLVFEKAKAYLPNKEWSRLGGHKWNILDLDSDLDLLGGIEVNKRRPFKQANDLQNKNMLQWLESVIKNENKEQAVMELFCGSGNFTQIFSKKGFKKIYAYEIGSDAIQILKSKTLPGVFCDSLDLFNVSSWKKIKAADTKILFLDPPREGFEALDKFIDNFPELNKIIYVSCDPMTWLRDTKKLLSKGYKLEEIQPIDQFPQTPHLEILSVLTKTTKA